MATKTERVSHCSSGAAVEHWGCSEVDKGWIDVLPCEQLLHHLRRGVPDSPVLHIDEVSVVGLERVASVQIGQAICAHDLPVCPTRLKPDATRGGEAGHSRT